MSGFSMADRRCDLSSPPMKKQRTLFGGFAVTTERAFKAPSTSAQSAYNRLDQLDRLDSTVQ